MPWRRLRQGWYDLPCAVGAGTDVRTQVRDRDGAIVGASNTLWLLRTLHPQASPHLAASDPRPLTRRAPSPSIMKLAAMFVLFVPVNFMIDELTVVAGVW
ncbi:hypothetical protein V2I01_36800 [Micromonospora sp. BRA006-A]|nr:hypothetical protein [Micromonospora sp. BRA006-A]